MSQKKGTLTSALLLAAHLFSTLASAGTEYEVIRLPISDQLPQRSVERLHSDFTEHLWIRTQAGYHRFDGNKLENLYTFERSGLRERRHNNLSRHLIPTSDGSMWLLDSDRGLARYDVSASTFKQFVGINEGIFANGRVATSYLYDSRRRLWITFSDREIATIDSALETESRPELAMQLQAEDFISAMAEASDGSLLLLSNQGVLLDCSTDGTNCVMSYLPEKAGIPGPFRPLWIAAGRDDVFYISTYNKGAFLYERVTGKLRKLALAPDGKPEPKFGSAPPFCITKEGGVWVATMEGLFHILDNQLVERIHTENSSLATNVMNTVIEIGDGEYLAGSVEGIYLVRKSPFENYTEESGLRSTLMTGFAAYSSEIILLSTFQGLDVLNLLTNKIEPAESYLPGLSLVDPRVMAVHQKAGTTWLGFFNHGLYKYEASSSAIYPIVQLPRQIQGVSDVAEIDDQTIAITTVDSGIYLIDNFSGEVSRMQLATPQDSDKATEAFFTIRPLLNGDIIAGSIDGIVLIHTDNPRARDSAYKASLHVKGTDVYSVFQSSTGDVWAGTHEQGLHVWQKSKGIEAPNFLQFETSPKLPSKTIYAIEEDHLGMLWLSTNNGLVRLSPNTGQISVFDRTDGLVANEFNHGASFVDWQGRLYFGGHDGFTRFDPSNFSSERIPPPLRLTGISISKDSVPFDTAYVYNPSVTLGHNDYAVDFEFSTMDVTAPGRSQFKYKLEGFDRDWVDNGNKTTATFTNLPSGDYVFRVIGANSDGVWNYDGISIPVKVLPAPWQTWWATALYLVAGLVLISFMKRYYDTRLLNREAIRQKKIMTNTAIRAMDELQDQLEQEHRLVRNLRKHAASTIELIDESLGIEADELSDAKARKSIHRSQQRLDCLKALESSVYFQGDTLKVNLHDAVDHMFPKLLQASLPQSAEIILVNEVCDELIPIDIAAPAVVLLHELILNSVNHAFNNSEGIECVEVNLYAKSGPKRWILRFSDTGSGLSPDITTDRPVTRGMRLISKTAQKIGGHLEIDRSRGTAFTIVIPQPADY